MQKSKAGTKWLFKMAWRDAKASYKRLSLFMASIVLGIGAVVSIQSFGENLKSNIELQSKALMGADYIIDSRHAPNERVQGIIDSLGGADAREINFASMGFFPKNGGTKLVRVKGLEGDFPFYGDFETTPNSAGSSYQQEGKALVDATLMLQYDIQAGDSIKIGNVTFPIAGSLDAAPGTGGFSSGIAPTVYIPYRYIEQTGLIQVGSRLEYQYYFVASEETDLVALHEKLDPVLDAEEADMDTHIDSSQQLGQRYQNFGVFLNLVAFIALLLGCVGIASSVNIYVKEKLRSVAVLKCLGATRKQSFLIFLIQIMGMGFFGGLLGSLLGIFLQELFPYILSDMLPFAIETTIYPASVIVGIVLGVFMSMLFALIPLLSTWFVSPLRVLRIEESTNEKSKKANFLVLGIILLFMYGFSYWLLNNWKYSLYFILGILITFLVLVAITRLFMKLIKNFFPSSWGFISRQSLLNLFRPQNQTMTLILAIGVGTFLISTLYFTKDMLLAKLSFESSDNTPNIILMDVQNDQKDEVAKTLGNVIDNIPIVTMRVHSIKGQTANEIRKDTTSRVNDWMLNHEFRVTYRDSLIASESLVNGDWVASEKYDPEKPVSISIAESIERDGVLKVGDTLVFNVQGVLMTTKVANIRKVDWGRMQLNFSIVFPTGILETAPQFNVLSTHAADEKESAKLQSELIKQFPNISIIDFRQILVLIESVLNKISWVINFMAIFSIFTGIIVLIGAVRTSKFQRIRENVLLRTLGGTSKQILKITALEYIYLGVLGSLSGILLSLVSAQTLAYFIFDLAFVPSSFPFLVLFPGISLLVLAIGLMNSRSVLRSPPLQVLRKEAGS
ncbi:ABC transporter permease [Lutimonas sp.]|uniref:ABC transporter permease n=1 Tax=Lutimonas sp. TaxID=1872403 RepID=UPI003D9BE7B3